MPTSPAGSLTGAWLGDGHSDETLGAESGIVGFEFHESAVDDRGDVVDGERGLGDVGGDDYLPGVFGRGLEDAELLVMG